jgi:hypothetical protein
MCNTDSNQCGRGRVGGIAWLWAFATLLVCSESTRLAAQTPTPGDTTNKADTILAKKGSFNVDKANAGTLGTQLRRVDGSIEVIDRSLVEFYGRPKEGQVAVNGVYGGQFKNKTFAMHAVDVPLADALDSFFTGTDLSWCYDKWRVFYGTADNPKSQNRGWLKVTVIEANRFVKPPVNHECLGAVPTTDKYMDDGTNGWHAQ